MGTIKSFAKALAGSPSPPRTPIKTISDEDYRKFIESLLGPIDADSSNVHSTTDADIPVAMGSSSAFTDIETASPKALSISHSDADRATQLLPHLLDLELVNSEPEVYNVIKEDIDLFLSSLKCGMNDNGPSTTLKPLRTLRIDGLTDERLNELRAVAWNVRRSGDIWSLLEQNFWP